MTRFILLTGWILSAPMALAQDKENTPRLPKSPPPAQALAVVLNGKLWVKKASNYYVPKTYTDPKTGQSTTTYELNVALNAIEHEIDHIQAFDVRGNRIAAKRLKKLLQAEAPVLLANDNKLPDALHLRIYRDDIVVLVLSPANAPDGPPMGPGVAPVPAPAAPPVLIPVRPAPPPTPAPGSALQVELMGPRQQEATRDCEYTIRVMNHGSVKLTNLTILVRVPDKMSVPSLDGVELPADRLITAKVPDLDAGASRDESLKLTSSEKGEFRIRVTVWADRNFSQGAEMLTTIVDPAPPK